MQVGLLLDAVELLPHPAPAAEARLPQAADPDDAEVAAAPQALRLAASPRSRRAPLPPRAAGRRAARHDGVKLVKDDKIRRVVLCSGKVYYDLFEEREKRGIDDVYLMRVEQLYPFPVKSLATELARFKKADVVWCQEEPKNMGSWTFVEPYLEWVLKTGRRQGRAAALCRPPGLGRDGDRPDVQAPGAAPGLPRRGLRGLNVREACAPVRCRRRSGPRRAQRLRDDHGNRNPRTDSGRIRHQRPPSAAGSRSRAIP